MDSARVAKVVKGVGGLFHLIGIMAGSSAVYNTWTLIGRIVNNSYSTVTWGGVLYRCALCVLLVGGGLALGRWAEQINAGGDAERALASQAERDEIDRLAREIHVPRRRNQR